MVSLYLNDILKKNGLDPKHIKLIRHSLKHERCRLCYDNGFLDEYQKIQNDKFFKGCDFVLTFINEPGTSAKFVGCYKVGEAKPIQKDMMIEGFPVPKMFEEDSIYCDLQPSELLSDLRNRLIIEWGRSAVSWHQWATNEKAILAIQTNPKFEFSGYENVLLSFNELKEIVSDKMLYENWHTALSSIYAIYLIADTKNGQQYIGSAYGSGGLLDRWKCYVGTGHGGNKGIMDALAQYKDRYQYFQFSILQILPKTITNEEVIKIEGLYKSKLLSKQYGMNRN